MQHLPEEPADSSLAAIGLRLSNWFERWFPDAFALALAACAIVFVASLATGAAPMESAQWFGAGFWDLVTFTMQVAMIIVTGYAVAVSPPVYAVIRRMAGVPANGKSAVAFVALFSMLSSLVSWSFSLIFSGLLAREVAHRVAGADYRALGAAAYLGVGSVWALGLSSSAALIMAAPGLATRFDRTDQRRDSPRADAWPVAKPAHGRRAHRPVDVHRVSRGARHRAGTEYGADGRDVRAATNQHRQT